MREKRCANSQHLHVLHAASLRNICFTCENGLLHATHVLSRAAYCLAARGEGDVVDDALPGVVALAVLLDQGVVLFFFDCIIGLTLFNLRLALRFPLA